jgi:hypothetical protein
MGSRILTPTLSQAFPLKRNGKTLNDGFFVCLLLLSRHYTIPQPSSLFSGRVSYVYPKPTSDHKSSYLWLPKYLGSQVHAITPGLFVDMGCSLTTPQPSTPQTTVLPISASRAAEHRCEPHRLALNDVFDESDLFYHTLKRHSSLAAATLPLVSSPVA